MHRVFLQGMGGIGCIRLHRAELTRIPAACGRALREELSMEGGSLKGGMQGMIASVCAEEFGAKASYMGCRNCDYGDLCEVGERGGSI